LPETQLSQAQRRALLQPVFDGTQALLRVSRPAAKGQGEELVAEGFVVDVTLTASVDDKAISWTERRWLVRSQAYAQAQQATPERRLAAASAALHELVRRKQGKKRRFYAALMQAAAQIVNAQGVQGLLHYDIQAVLQARPVRAYRGQPAREEIDVSFTIEVRRDEPAIGQHKQ